MLHPLQTPHRNHSQLVKVKLGIKVIKLVKSLIGWEVTVTDRRNVEGQDKQQELSEDNKVRRKATKFK